MQLLPVLGVTAAAAALSLALLGGGTAPTTPPAVPVANGHDVLVVEGDRDSLTITHASHKADPWSGVPKGFSSDWTLQIRDAAGELLATVPLDVSPFATSAADKGAPRRVQGCIVVDSRIGMLVNAPTFAPAVSYEFVRGNVTIGRIDAAEVRRLTGGPR